MPLLFSCNLLVLAFKIFIFVFDFELVHRGTDYGVMTVLESVGLVWIDNVDVVLNLGFIFF